MQRQPEEPLLNGPSLPEISTNPIEMPTTTSAVEHRAAAIPPAAMSNFSSKYQIHNTAQLDVDWRTVFENCKLFRGLKFDDNIRCPFTASSHALFQFKPDEKTSPTVNKYNYNRISIEAYLANNER